MIGQTFLTKWEDVRFANHPDRGPGAAARDTGELSPFVAARLADLLDLRQRARVRGYRDTETAYTDRIIDEVWRCPNPVEAVA